MSYTMQTPQRPLPGAYIQTPAVGNYSSYQSRPSNFRSTSASSQQQHVSQPHMQTLNQQSQAGAPVVPREEVKPIARAAKAVSEALEQESRYPELDSYIGQGTSSDYDLSPQATWTPFQKVKTYTIPDRIFEQYNQAQVSTMMGLFAEFNHAWVAIDNALYLWDYTHPNPNLIGFEEQPNTITAVQLVTPRVGVFVSSISRLLVVATTAEVILIGFSAQGSSTGGFSVSLYALRMSVPAKGLDVSVIEGSKATGRIFFSSRSSDDVYEFTYQQEEKWFQGRCAKINHTSKGYSAFTPGLYFGRRPQQEMITQMVVDDSRSLLYTLSSKSTIRTFHMKANAALELTITKPFSQTLTSLSHMSSQSDLLSPSMSIVSISAVTRNEAIKIHLVATTSSGCRLFMSATSSYYSASPNAPTSMQVQHVKFPPTDTSVPQLQGQQSTSNSVTPYANTGGRNLSSKALSPTRTAVRYAPGYFLCFVSPRPETDVLFVSGPDSGRIARPQDISGSSRYAELGMWINLGSRAEDIGLASTPFAAAQNPIGFGNELAVQYDRSTSEIVILTNTGLHTLRRRRLVDIFATALRVGGDDGLDGEIRKFIRLYGRGETASTALAVACGQGLDVTSDSRVAKILDPDVLEQARKVFIEHGGKPQFNENSLVDQSLLSVDLVRPSPRHEGLSLYVSRLVRSIWKAPIALEQVSPIGGLAVTSVVTMNKLQEISESLSTLKEFLETNKSFIEGLAGPDALSSVTTKQEEISLQAEHRALHALVVLIHNIIEGIAFVLVLYDEKIEEILQSLQNDTRQQVRNLTYEGLFSTDHGKALAKELVKAIVNRNIASGSNVETIADALRRRCGSFCSADDVVIFKSQELVKRASGVGTETEASREYLNESLRSFKGVAESLSMEQLQWAVEQYVAMQFYAGAIQLCLVKALESDRGNRALSWIQDGRPERDNRIGAFEARKRCYNLVHEVIVSLERAKQEMPDMVDGHYTVNARRREEASQEIDGSEDEVFQTDLYDWYLAKGEPDRLLGVESPFIITYLQRKSSENIEHADLLWRYYAQAERYQDAAVVQLALGKSAFQLSLDRRIEYLSRAKANASINRPGIVRPARTEVLREVSDLLDVANIQDDLLQRLKGDSRIASDRRPSVIQALDGRILNLSELYNTYAEPAMYFDLCILIYDAADHRSPSDIKATWQNLLERVHEETVESGEAQPYEAVGEQVRTLGKRLGLSEIMFPVPNLLPLLMRYAFEFQREVAPESWAVDLFIDVQVPLESIYAVLEEMYYNDEPPFSGRNRRFVCNEIVYIIRQWFHDSTRGTGQMFGGEQNAASISQMLHLMAQSGLSEHRLDECQRLRMRIENMMR